MKKNVNIVVILFICLFGGIRLASAQNVVRLSLKDAQDMAVKQNRLLKISRLREQESIDSLNSMKSKYYPNADATALYSYTTNTDVIIPEGILGNISGFPIPDRDYKVFEGRHGVTAGGVRITQPVTQLTKISTGVKVAEKSAAIARTQTRKNELKVKQGVEKLYYGILIARKQKEQALVDLDLYKAQLYDLESALLAGETDSTKYYGLQAEISSGKQKVMQADYQIDNYTADLLELINLPADTKLETDSVIHVEDNSVPVSEYHEKAESNNPDVQMAILTRDKAKLGVLSAQKNFIPDLSVVAGYTYQNILRVLPENNYHVGVLLTWKIWDWGTRKSLLDQRKSQESEATELLEYTKEHVLNATNKAYRNKLQARQLLDAAAKSVEYRKQELRFAENRKAAGEVLKKDVLAAKSNLAKAETDYLSALLNYRITDTDLKIAAGDY